MDYKSHFVQVLICFFSSLGLLNASHTTCRNFRFNLIFLVSSLCILYRMPFSFLLFPFKHGCMLMAAVGTAGSWKECLVPAQPCFLLQVATGYTFLVLQKPEMCTSCDALKISLEGFWFCLGGGCSTGVCFALFYITLTSTLG